MNSNFSLKDFNKRFEAEKYIIISEAELTALLNSSKIVFEHDTKLRDFIRILRIENLFYLQETTNQGEKMIRKFESEADAMSLVIERLEIYDKMWDGCGCKINYYE